MNDQEFLKECHNYIDLFYQEFKTYQSLALDILNVFHRICQKNNISYFVIYGTLLGFVRDKGIIPWDADIDVAISIDDVGILIDALERELPSEYFFESNYNCEKSLYTQLRIGNKKWNLDFIHVDVFYLIGAPNNNQHAFRKEVSSLYHCRYNYLKYKYLPFKKLSNREKAKKVAFFFKYFFVTRKGLVKHYNKIVGKYPFDSSKYLCTVTENAYIFEKNKVFPTKNVLVNSNEVMYPFDEEYLLNCCYKNYHEYMPIKSRFNELLTWKRAFDIAIDNESDCSYRANVL